MAYLGEIQTRGEITDVKQLVNYMYQLEEQVRYALNNLDGENIQAGAISAEQLSGTLNARLKSVERMAERLDERGADRLTNQALSLNGEGFRQGMGLFQSRAGADSYLHWGGTDNAPALSLDGQGNILAQALTLPDGEIVQKGADTLPFRVYIGIDRPQEGGMLWFKPGTLTDGVQTCEVFYIPQEEEAEA